MSGLLNGASALMLPERLAFISEGWRQFRLFHLSLCRVRSLGVGSYKASELLPPVFASDSAFGTLTWPPPFSYETSELLVAAEPAD